MKIFHDLGISQIMYWGCYVVGFITIFIFNGFWGKKYNIKFWKALFFTVVSYILIYLWAYILAWIINGFEWGHHNAIRVYIWMPIVMLLTCKLFKINWKIACEFIVPSTCIVYGIARMGCVFAGCCYGIPSTFGIYSVAAGHVCFPVQLFEALTALIIAVITIIIAKKHHFNNNGYLYPLMLIMYGGTRFFWEFFADNEKIFLNISELAIWAFISFIIGMVSFLYISYKERSKSNEG